MALTISGNGQINIRVESYSRPADPHTNVTPIVYKIFPQLNETFKGAVTPKLLKELKGITEECVIPYSSETFKDPDRDKPAALAIMRIIQAFDEKTFDNRKLRIYQINIDPEGKIAHHLHDEGLDFDDYDQETHLIKPYASEGKEKA